MGLRVLRLFCLPMSHKKDARLIWVNIQKYQRYIVIKIVTDVCICACTSFRSNMIKDMYKIISWSGAIDINHIIPPIKLASFQSYCQIVTIICNVKLKTDSFYSV